MLALSSGTPYATQFLVYYIVGMVKLDYRVQVESCFYRTPSTSFACHGREVHICCVNPLDGYKIVPMSPNFSTARSMLDTDLFPSTPNLIHFQ